MSENSIASLCRSKTKFYKTNTILWIEKRRITSSHPHFQVEIEDHPYLAKSEGVNCIPAFKIYKNGSRVKEIPGNNHELLEKLVKLYSS